MLELYGYPEPLRYREPRYDLIMMSKWRQVRGTGTLSGRVTFLGNPIPDALVTVYDGKLSGSDANGRYTIPDIPYGPCVANIDLESTTLARNITLNPPNDLFRTALIDGYIYTHNKTFVGFVNTSDDPPLNTLFHKKLRVGPYGTHKTDRL